eukprot:5791545-Amphidinium_carterae.1
MACEIEVQEGAGLMEGSSRTPRLLSILDAKLILHLPRTVHMPTLDLGDFSKAHAGKREAVNGGKDYMHHNSHAFFHQTRVQTISATQA